MEKNGDKNGISQATEFCLRLLSCRQRSAFELEQKLERRGFRKDVIKTALEGLERRGYLDDEAFSRNLILSRFRNKLWGRLKIASELRKKGISREIIQKTLGQVEKALEKESLRNAIGKWLKKEKPLQPLSKEDVLRATRHLQIRGFQSSLINSALSNRSCNPIEEECLDECE